MPLTASFTVAATSDETAAFLTDTSTGSDVAITDRKILLYDISNTLLGTYDWPIADSSITINPFTKDISVNVVVNWVDVDGNTLYTYSLLFAAVQFAVQFLYSLIQQLQAKPTKVNDQVFFDNLKLLDLLIDSAQLAIDTGGDQYSAETCISLYQNMINNQISFF